MGDKEDDGEGDETAGKARFPVLPSLISLQQMRNRLATAQSGRRLMMWSAMATGAELRRIAKELNDQYIAFTEEVADAFITLARCRFHYPNLNKIVIENHPPTACVTVGKSMRSIAGCRVFTYAIEDHCPDAYPYLGIEKGGELIFEAKKVWHELLRKMIFIEQLRSNFLSLEESHDATNKKAKVLGKIIIPRTVVTIRYILSELEELEREEFFRLKKVLEVKNRIKKKKKEAEKKKGKDEDCPICIEETKQEEASTKEKKETEKDKERVKEKPPKCVVCDGPMHVHAKQPLTEEIITREHEAIEGIKENLDKVLAATDNFEKKTAKTESLKDFKRTAEELKQKLRTPPTTIPDGVKVEELCDLCREIYKIQRSKCIVCDEPVGDKGKSAAKESRNQLRKQLDTVLSSIKQYEEDGQEGDKLKQFKATAAELQKKLKGPPIPKNVDVERLCADCKDRMNEDSGPAKKTQSKVSIKSPPKSKPSTSASVASSAVSSDLPLGVFETEEITEIIKVKNPDGTVSEKRRSITIKRKQPDNPSGSGTSQNQDDSKDKKVGLVSVIHHRKGFLNRLPGSAQSEYAIPPLPMVDRMIKSCLSTNLDYNFDEVLESITELASREISNSSDNYGSHLAVTSNHSILTRYRKENELKEDVDDSSLNSELPEASQKDVDDSSEMPEESHD